MTGPVSLRVSLTDRCQLRCRYCMQPGGVTKVTHEEILTFEEIVSFVRMAKGRFGLMKVHLTGGEPLIRRGVVDLVGMLAEEGIGDLALTTNGHRLGELANGLAGAGLRRVNVSLDTLRERTFRRLTRGGRLRDTLGGIAAAKRAALDPVKLNATVLRGTNDDELADIVRFGMKHGCEVRFIELMPIGPARRRFDDWFVSSAEVLRRLRSDFDLQPLPSRPGLSSRIYRATDRFGREGIIGVISSCTKPFCGQCRRLRLTSTGQLIGCLAMGEGLDIRPLLRGGAACVSRLADAVEEALCLKRTGRNFTTARPMATVGG